MNLFGNLVISGANLEKIGDLMGSDDPNKQQAAAEELAEAFGKAVQATAGKGARGSAMLDSLMGNLKDLKETSSLLGTAAGGDPKPAHIVDSMRAWRTKEIADAKSKEEAAKAREFAEKAIAHLNDDRRLARSAPAGCGERSRPREVS